MGAVLMFTVVPDRILWIERLLRVLIRVAGFDLVLANYEVAIKSDVIWADFQVPVIARCNSKRASLSTLGHSPPPFCHPRTMWTG